MSENGPGVKLFSFPAKTLSQAVANLAFAITCLTIVIVVNVVNVVNVVLFFWRTLPILVERGAR